MWRLQKNLTFLVLLLWRLLSVFVTQTAHVPDEYWQSLEVAHKLAFDYGYLTWEWHTGIRSYIYPFLISLLYRALKILYLDFAEALIIFPKLLQAILSAYADYRFYLWTNKNKLALLSLCVNWYWYYCATRTIINTMETSMTMIALSIFPWRNSDFQSTKFLWIVGFLCIARPTAAIVWLPLCLYHYCTSEIPKIILAVRYALIGFICFSLSTLVDILHYGRFIVTPWEFLRVNVVLKISDFYGAESFCWYLTSGLPVLLGLQYFLLPTVFWRVWRHPKHLHKQAVLCVVIIWTIILYSLLTHKEFRFILPLLPMFIYVITSVGCFSQISRKWRKCFVLIFCISNLGPGLYFSLIHQRGSLDAMSFIRNELSNDISKMHLLFLTPCHATPLYSHIHKNVSVKFLTCEPNLNNVPGYIDEADQFFAKPIHWLNNYYLSNESLPSHIILFDNTVHKILPFLEDYKILMKIFYAHFTQNNYGQNIFIYKRNDLFI